RAVFRFCVKQKPRKGRGSHDESEEGAASGGARSALPKCHQLANDSPAQTANAATARLLLWNEANRARPTKMTVSSAVTATIRFIRGPFDWQGKRGARTLPAGRRKGKMSSSILEGLPLFC